MKHLLPLLAVLFLISCNKNDDPVAHGPLLKSYTIFFQNQSGEFRPAEKIEYSYDLKGALIKTDQSQYDIESKSFNLFSTSNFVYDHGRLVTIDKALIDYPQKSITRYEYFNGRVSRIVLDEEIDTEAKIGYLADNQVEITYTSSNGRWFTYRFTTTNNNKEIERTFGEDLEIDSEIIHEYDNRKNPFSLLGYDDFFFENASANNRIKTTSKYFGGSYPQSVPVSYEYQYNELNYPTQKITTYKSLGQSGATSQLKTVFEYW